MLSMPTCIKLNYDDASCLLKDLKDDLEYHADKRKEWTSSASGIKEAARDEVKPSKK